MLEESEEAMLCAWSARGDREALDRLVRRLWPEAFRLASRCLGDHAAAEDAAQESCARLARGRSPSGEPGSVRRWFSRIVLNVVRSHLRARGRRSAHEARAGSERAEQADAVLDGLETHEVRRRVGDLPCELREPLVLHFWGELPHREVAETLGLSKSTTTWRIARGLERLRQSLSASAAAVPLDALEALVRGLQATAAPAAPSAVTILRRSGRRAWQRLGAGLVATALALGAAHLALADGDGLAPPVARAGADARAPEAPGPAAITSSVPGRAWDPGTRPSAAQPAGEAASSPRAPDEEHPRSDESFAPPGSSGSPVIEARALATVAGRVVGGEGGLPIPGADVTVFPLDDVEQRISLDSSGSAHTSTSQDGAFRLALPAPRPAGVAGLLLTVRAPGHAPFMRLLPPEGRADLDLVLAPGGLALGGVVVAADGSALAGLRLKVVVPFLASTSGQPLGEERPAEVQAEVLTGPDGRFWLDGLPESSSGAVFVLPGQGVLGQVSGYPRAEPPELRLVARLACRVGVRVVDASGCPVRGALVDLVDGRLVDPVDLADERPAERMATDREGRCAFESLQPRRHLVRVRLPMRNGAVSPAHVSLTADLSAAGQSVEVTAHLTRPPVPLTVCVADAAGTRRAGVGVLVIQDDQAGLGQAGDVEGTTDAQGEVEFDQLPPGLYRLVATEDRGVLEAYRRNRRWWPSGSLPSKDVSTRSRVVLTLDVEPRLHGRVIDPWGAPLAGATVDVARTLARPKGAHLAGVPRGVVTDAAGRFEYGPVAELVDVVIVRAQGSVGRWVTFDRAAVKRGEPVVVQLDSAFALSVNARLATPVADNTPVHVIVVGDSPTRPASKVMAVSVPTVSDGEFQCHFRALDWRPRAVWVRVDGFVHLMRPLSDGQETLTLDQLVLDRGRSLSGRLVDPSLAPLDGERVSVQLAGYGGELPVALYSFPIEPDGRFRLSGLPAERVEALLWSGNRATVADPGASTDLLGDVVVRSPALELDAIRLVEPGPALVRVGLRPGDLIVKIGGKAFSSGAELTELMSLVCDSREHELEVVRGSARLTVLVVVRSGEDFGRASPAMVPR
jgi:RNA polymerase sigma-70 factor (ECF subfamily)